jgi:apolipoprotein D and lipocalin family protein
MGPGEAYFTSDLIGWGAWYSGTFRVLELAGDYSYAMLGDTGGSRLWILSRTRHMAPELYNRLVARATERGYDTAQLVRSAHNGL